MAQHTFINLHLNKYIQWLRYYPFAVKLDSCAGNDKCRWECINGKEHHMCEKDYIWNLATCTCENAEY